MESWRAVFRDGFAPAMSTAALDALRAGLIDDDDRLTQGSTTTPPPLMCVSDWPCEGGCGVAFAGMVGDGLETVGEVEEYFAKACFEADKRLGEPGGCRWLLNWFDETPRNQMRAELLGEVVREIQRRDGNDEHVPSTELSQAEPVSVPF